MDARMLWLKQSWHPDLRRWRIPPILQPRPCPQRHVHNGPFVNSDDWFSFRTAFPFNQNPQPFIPVGESSRFDLLFIRKVGLGSYRNPHVRYCRPNRLCDVAPLDFLVFHKRLGFFCLIARDLLLQLHASQRFIATLSYSDWRDFARSTAAKKNRTAKQNCPSKLPPHEARHRGRIYQQPCVDGTKTASLHAARPGGWRETGGTKRATAALCHLSDFGDAPCLPSACMSSVFSSC
jgi:hypothetical protein